MYIKVRVISGAKKELVEKLADNNFKLTVREKAERNLANRRVVELIAAQFRVTSRAVRIVNGHHSPSKLLSVEV